MLIAFEGLPGAGKTTQSRRLSAYLASSGQAVTYLPDNLTRDADALGRTLLDLFRTGEPFARHDHIVTEVHLAAAIRANTYAQQIVPALDDGHTVIEDRGLHTMYSYGLAGLRQRHHADLEPSIAWLHTIGKFAGPPADHTILLWLPFDLAIDRATQRQGHPYTPEQRRYLHAVHTAYAALAEHEPTLHRIDCTNNDADQVLSRILEFLEPTPANIPGGNQATAQRIPAQRHACE